MTALIGLSQNLVLLLSLTFVYGLIAGRLSRLSYRQRSVVEGLLFGTFGVVSMMMPLQVANGVIFDGRSLMVAAAGLYGGPIPALIAAVMVMIYRFTIGGIGALASLGGISLVALLAIAIHYASRRRITIPVLVTMGLLIAVDSGFWMLSLSQIGIAATQSTLPLALWVFPIGMLAVGLLLNAQQERLNLQRRYRAIFNSTYQFIGLMTTEGVLLEANQTMLNFGGVKPEDVIGKPFWETHWWKISPQTQQQLREAISRAARGEFVRYEVDVSGAGSTIATIDFSIKPVYDERGVITLLIPEGRDISLGKQLERHKIELELEHERHVLLRNFISSVSHDFKTPLTILNTNLYLLTRITDPQNQKERIQLMRQQTERLNNLLEDMLTMSRLETDVSALNARPMALNALIEQLAHKLEPVAAKHEQRVALDLDSALPPIPANEGLLVRAVDNLLDNAHHYTPDGGTITVSTRLQGQDVVIEVRDTGIGIGAGDLPHIFDSLYRGDKARSLDTGGSGLGLTMSKRIVEAHGGHIDVESAADQGSVFRIVLPLVAEPEQNAILS